MDDAITERTLNSVSHEVEVGHHTTPGTVCGHDWSGPDWTGPDWTGLDCSWTGPDLRTCKRGLVNEDLSNVD